MRPFGSRDAWLSLTPEPERELPRALATLRHGGPPPGELIDSERLRVEHLVTHGSRRAWLAYLRKALGAARSTGADPELAEARALIEEVTENHDNLALGLARRNDGGPE